LYNLFRIELFVIVAAVVRVLVGYDELKLDTPLHVSESTTHPPMILAPDVVHVNDLTDTDPLKAVPVAILDGAPVLCKYR